MPVCVTLGNFDGLHRGHQQLLQHLKAQAAQHKAKTLVICFEPQPLEFLNPDAAPARIYSLNEKVAVVQSSVDYVVSIAFDETLQKLPAQAFLNLLTAHLNVKGITVGDDFCFGYQRSGNIEFLQTYAKSQSIALNVLSEIKDDNARISSTAVRDALSAGKFDDVERLLGRSYAMSGEVIHGDKRGRQIGVPTANIDIMRTKSPLKGVFIVKASINGSEPHPAVANLGTRPTFDGKKIVLEVHLLGFDEDCYGKQMQVQFVSKIRDEMKFESFEVLKQQIFDDIQVAREHFNL